MKVGIEGSLFFKRPTGVGYYAQNLTRAAAQLDSDVEFEVVKHVLPWAQPVKPLNENSHLEYRFVRWFPPAVYYQIFKRLNWFVPYDLVALRKYNAFLFYNFATFPVRRNCKSIVAIHDLSFIIFPEYTQAKNLKYQTKLLPKTIKRADYIITVSQNSKDEIVKYYNVNPGLIHVIPNAVDHQHFYPRTAQEIEAVRKKYKLPARFIHFHSTIEPRKNVQGLLDAYQALPTELKNQYALVLTGGKGWKDEQIYQKINELKAGSHQIILPGYIDDADLPAVYSAASLFVFPSFYEGFGIPPLEAMACGVPVICADNSSLPEVVGNAAKLIKAEDTQQISQAIREVLTNQHVAKNLSKAGLAQAKKFNWQISGQKLIDLLQSLA